MLRLPSDLYFMASLSWMKIDGFKAWKGTVVTVTDFFTECLYSVAQWIMPKSPHSQVSNKKTQTIWKYIFSSRPCSLYISSHSSLRIRTPQKQRWQWTHQVGHGPSRGPDPSPEAPAAVAATVTIQGGGPGTDPFSKYLLFENETLLFAAQFGDRPRCLGPRFHFLSSGHHSCLINFSNSPWLKEMANSFFH